MHQRRLREDSKDYWFRAVVGLPVSRRLPTAVSWLVKTKLGDNV